MRRNTYALSLLKGRQSLRLAGHDYRWSRYFVTIRARHNEPVFETPELHQIIEAHWYALPQRFPSVTLNEFVIMPDHIHFIICLDGMRKDAPPLGSIVGAYKSLTTTQWLKHVRMQSLSWEGTLWQRNYYEEIIFDSSAELEHIRQYIRDNPQRAERGKSSPS